MILVKNIISLYEYISFFKNLDYLPKKNRLSKM